MTNQQHPITPPPKLLVQEWAHMLEQHTDAEVFTQAASWGADQELEACCEWLSNRSSLTERLRAARRPKPPSLKEQALEVLERCSFVNPKHENILRRALELLDD